MTIAYPAEESIMRPDRWNVKLVLIKLTPWWILSALWRGHIVKRETIFRWEMNEALGEWK